MTTEDPSVLCIEEGWPLALESRTVLAITFSISAVFFILLRSIVVSSDGAAARFTTGAGTMGVVPAAAPFGKLSVLCRFLRLESFPWLGVFVTDSLSIARIRFLLLVDNLPLFLIVESLFVAVGVLQTVTAFSVGTLAAGIVVTPALESIEDVDVKLFAAPPVGLFRP